MFTGGHCHSRAIPSAPPPPAEATKLTPLRSTPPPELSASTAELTITSTITTATLRGLFSDGLFPGGRGTKKKRQKIVCRLKVICYLTCVRIDSSNNNNNNQPNTIMRHYYALSDSYTGPNPTEPSSGFADATVAIAFSSLGARTAWLAATKLLKARAITRPEALKLTPTLKAPAYIKGLKVVPLWDTDAAGRAMHTGGVVTLQDSTW